MNQYDSADFFTDETERILARTRDIRLSDAHHGPAGSRHFDYEPTWLLRAVRELHIEFTSVE